MVGWHQTLCKHLCFDLEGMEMNIVNCDPWVWFWVSKANSMFVRNVYLSAICRTDFDQSAEILHIWILDQNRKSDEYLLSYEDTQDIIRFVEKRAQAFGGLWRPHEVPTEFLARLRQGDALTLIQK